MNKLHFTDLTEYHRFLDIEPPEHPLFSVVALSSTISDEIVECVANDVPFSSDFYSIALKHIISGEIHYGRTKYDCKNGAMIFTSPQQEIRAQGVKTKSTGRAIIFHQDFVRGHPIKEQLKQYHYFSYAINEALHLSPKEESMIAGIFDQIELEYHNNQDAFSKELILSQLDTLLRYANRFYHRQFLHRKQSVSDTHALFINSVEAHFSAEDEAYKTLPSVEAIAESLNMTPRYLSDALKVETGSTAIENLHLYLMDKAKDMLLKPDMTVATVAYNLGFEYPQYFARLFKKKVGVTPTEYRQQVH